MCFVVTLFGVHLFSEARIFSDMSNKLLYFFTIRFYRPQLLEGNVFTGVLSVHKGVRVRRVGTHAPRTWDLGYSHPPSDIGPGLVTPPPLTLQY